MKRTILLALLFAAALIAIDQASKHLVAGAFDVGERISLIPNLLYLTKHHNEGAAWGILQGATVFFVIITIIALALFLFLLRDGDFKRKTFYTIGVTLLIAGTIGNFIDRIALGYVIDFIDVYIFTYNFPIFNVADMALTIGVIMLVVDLVFFEERRGQDA